MAYFKCKGEAGKNIDYLYKWDFTKSLTDRVTGTVATLNSATRTDEHGITLLNSDSYVSIAVSGNSLIANGRTLEIDFGTVSKSYSGRHGRFIMYDDDEGFIFRNGSDLWQVYSSSGWRSYTETSSNPDVFSNKTLKMVFNTNSLMDVYANNELVYSGYPFFSINSTSMLIGSSSQSFINAEIKALRIYNNQ